jgi:hypothetical protein
MVPVLRGLVGCELMAKPQLVTVSIYEFMAKSQFLNLKIMCWHHWNEYNWNAASNQKFETT